MKHSIHSTITMLLFLGAVTAAGGEEEPSGQSTRGDEDQEVTMETPYIAPDSPRTPNTRIIVAGSRGIADNGSEITLAMPEHVAYTVSPHPTLYWYLSRKVTDRSVVVTLIDESKPIDSPDGPLLEQTLKGVARGRHKLDLGALTPPVRLAVGRRYKWSVSVQDAEHASSADLVAEARIQRVEESTVLKTARAQNNGDKLAAVYGRNGIWVDAFHHGSPAAKSKLLEAVGLSDLSGKDTVLSTADSR